jgi:hypothetical protein
MWEMGMMWLGETGSLAASYRYKFGETIEKPASIAVETA